MTLRVFGTNPGKVQDLLERFDPNNFQTPSNDLEGFLALENVQCYDHEGRVVESYPVVYVRTDVEKDGNKILFKSPQDCVFDCKEKDLVLPSFALTCAIVQRLFEQKENSEFLRVLLQYKDKSNGNGYHTVNTIVDWNQRKIIHYPQSLGNSLPQRVHPFEVSGLKDMELSKALKNSIFRNYLIDLTGLKEPKLLLDLGVFFDRKAYVWIPVNQNYTSGGWFGCGDNYLNLDTGNDLTFNNGFRGVRFGAQKISGGSQ